MYFLTLWDEVTDAAVGALRSLSLSLCDLIYRLIVFCFNVFEKIGTAKLLSDETIQVLYEKVGLILGIYMIFRLTFVGVQYVLDPDAMTDKVKGTGNLVKKIILVIVLLGTTPFIFNCAYYIQDAVIQEGILSKFILGTDGNTDDFGADLSWYLFSTFYRKTEIELSDSDSCLELDSGLIENDFKRNTSFKYTYNCINAKGVYSDIENGETETYVIDFEGLIAIIAGGAVLWMIVMYTISVGFRLIQLAFLQLIAPIPIMMYLEPKSDGPFQKWVKQCVSCYLDYFIRTLIIYFIVFLVQSIMNSDSSYFYETLNGVTEKEYRYIIVIVILGLLTFAKKLPELLKDILPSSGSGLSDYGLSFKKRTENMLFGNQVYGLGKMGTVGLVGAAATGTVGLLGGRGVGRLTGLVGGMARGLTGSARNGSALGNLQASMKKQADVNRKKIDWANSGSTWGGRMRQRIDNVFGLEGDAEGFDNEIREIDHNIEQAEASIAERKRRSQAYQEVSNTKSKMLDRALEKLENDTFDEDDPRLKLQQALLQAQSKLEYLQQNGESEQAIFEAKVDLNKVKKDNSEKYVGFVIDGTIENDAAMTSMVEHVRNVVRDNHDGAFVGLDTEFVNFNQFKAFEGAVSERNSNVGEEIAGVERQIQILKDNKANRMSSDEYREANANRNAVGGHKGSGN